MICAFEGYTQSSPFLFDDKVLHEIKIDFSEDYPWDSLVYFYGFNLRKEYLPVCVSIDGNALDSVGIRYKGISSYRWAKNDKKPLKLDFNEFIADQSYQGFKKLNLHNGAADPSMMREYLGYKFLRSQGLPASRTAFAKVFVNGDYWGLYLMVEQVDKTFLKQHYGTKKGMLVKNKGRYRLNSILKNKKDLEWNFDVKTKGAEDEYQQFLKLTRLINLEDDETFEQEIGKIFDVDNFLKIVAVRLAIKDQDSFHTNGNNYYLYYNPDTEKIHMIPWDLNLTMDLVLNPPRKRNQDECFVRAYFTYEYLGENNFQFVDQRFDSTMTSRWNFGDGTYSNQKNPTHYYSQEGNYEVCLEVSDPKFEDCNRSYCTKIYTSQSIENCFSDIPDSYTWKWVKETITRRSGCCDKKWDNGCELIYRDLMRGGRGFFPISSERNYSLYRRNARNPLMSRLMKVPKYQTIFYSAIQQMIDHFQDAHFLDDQQEKSKLIQEAVESDPHYTYPLETFYYQNDFSRLFIKVKKEEPNIPSLIDFLTLRATELKNQIKSFQIKKRND